MIHKIKLLLCGLLAFTTTNQLLGTFTPIDSTQLTSILQNNRPNQLFIQGNLPFFIQKATFGGIDVTSKVQYHAVQGLLYIPNDGTQKIISFTMYDKSKPSLSYNYIFNCTSFALKNYTTATDNTYLNFRTIPSFYVDILNKINNGKIYTYPEEPKSVRNTQYADYPVRSNNITAFMQSMYGNKGIIPIHTNFTFADTTRDTYILNFILTIDKRSCYIQTSFSK